MRARQALCRTRTRRGRGEGRRAPKGPTKYTRQPAPPNLLPESEDLGVLRLRGRLGESGVECFTGGYLIKGRARARARTRARPPL